MSDDNAIKSRLLQQECHFTWSLREEDFSVTDLLNRLDEQTQLESREARVTRAYNSLGFVHYIHDNLQEALKNLQKSVQLANEHYKENSDSFLIVTYGNLAWLHYYMKEFSTCEDYLRLLERIHETSSEDLTYSISLEVLREKGWAFLKFCRKYYNGAKECFRQALERNPHDSDLNAGYAIALYRTTETPDSLLIQQLQRAIKLNPDDAVLLVLLALKMLQVTDDEKACKTQVELVISSLLKSRKNPHVLRYAAQFFRQLGNVDVAIRLLEKALKNTPNSAFLHHQLARCYSNKHQTLKKKKAECDEKYLNRSIYYLERAITLKPSFIIALADLALQYGLKGSFPNAEKKFEEAFESANIQKDQKDLQMVYCLFGQYQLICHPSEEKAIYNFMQGLRLHPETSEGKLCESYLRKIAEEYIKNTQNPRDSKASGIYGFIYEVKGEKQQAAKYYERALKYGSADCKSILLTEMRIWLLSFNEAGKSILNLIFDGGRYEEGLSVSGKLKSVKGRVAKKNVNLFEIDICNVKRILRWERMALNPGPHAVILAFSLEHGQFTEETEKILKDLEFLGEEFWNRVIVVFTEGDCSMSEYHGDQGRVLEWLLEKCGRRYYITGKESESLQKELSKKIMEMNKSMHLLLPQMSDGASQSLPEDVIGMEIKDDVLVTPEIIVQEGQTVYRISCRNAGWFQCKFTRLGFNMKGEGELLYSTVLPESGTPIPANCYPAGPLYDIKCVQGELCQLGLPHCETFIDDAIHSMSVVHYSGDSVEFLKPQNISSTHVTVNITGTSKFWMVKAINWFKEKIRGHVMLFYLQPTHKLHVFLQPHIVDPKKVAACNANYELIQTTCECDLKFNCTYSMTCDSLEEHGPSVNSIKIQPQNSKFCCTFKERAHYFPTFEIFLPNDVMKVKLFLNKEKPDPENVKVVWNCEILLEEYVTSKSMSCSTDEQCESFLKNNRCKIIQSVVNVDAILDGFADVIHPEKLNSIRALTTSQEKTRAILNFLDVRPALKQTFFSLLKNNEKDLVEDLMFNK
ncbi:uncharacterized protein [Misgurnus anguillicaudatus]|uniref:uncharacterized protein isoform X1 n=1 Tax=Misgurnus anguillicaudatus TaxID=75329 RepID=UPI003CCF993F